MGMGSGRSFISDLFLFLFILLQLLPDGVEDVIDDIPDRLGGFACGECSSRNRQNDRGLFGSVEMVLAFSKSDPRVSHFLAALLEPIKMTLNHSIPIRRRL